MAEFGQRMWFCLSSFTQQWRKTTTVPVALVLAVLVVLVPGLIMLLKVLAEDCNGPCLEPYPALEKDGCLLESEGNFAELS